MQGKNTRKKNVEMLEMLVSSLGEKSQHEKRNLSERNGGVNLT